MNSHRPGARVLVVEDLPLLRILIKDYLETRGFIPILKESAEEAIKALETENVDLIITDLYMPAMNGLDFVRHIKASGRQYRNTPVVMLTSERCSQKQAEARAAGVNEYIIKPITGDQLIEKISKLIRT